MGEILKSRKPHSNVRAAALKHGWRSGLEEAVGDALRKLGVPFKYEAVTLPYVPPQVTKKYTPDFTFSNGIVVETKGRWVTEDRRKVKLIREQYPDLDFRMVFSNPNTRISKLSKTSYGMYCEKLGIPYSKLTVPLEWTREPVNQKSLDIIERYFK